MIRTAAASSQSIRLPAEPIPREPARDVRTFGELRIGQRFMRTRLRLGIETKCGKDKAKRDGAGEYTVDAGRLCIPLLD